MSWTGLFTDVHILCLLWLFCPYPGLQYFPPIGPEGMGILGAQSYWHHRVVSSQCGWGETGAKGKGDHVEPVGGGTSPEAQAPVLWGGGERTTPGATSCSGRDQASPGQRERPPHQPLLLLTASDCPPVWGGNTGQVGRKNRACVAPSLCPTEEGSR